MTTNDAAAVARYRCCATTKRGRQCRHTGKYLVQSGSHDNAGVTKWKCVRHARGSKS